MCCCADNRTACNLPCCRLAKSQNRRGQVLPVPGDNTPHKCAHMRRIRRRAASTRSKVKEHVGRPTANGHATGGSHPSLHTTPLTSARLDTPLGAPSAAKKQLLCSNTPLTVRARAPQQARAALHRKQCQGTAWAHRQPVALYTAAPARPLRKQTCQKEVRARAPQQAHGAAQR